jgi:DNA-3-methyladenine glycosylase II
MERLHGVARAAQEGRLDAGCLLALGPEEAMVRLREIPGIGPFYSALIVIRSTGFADVLPVGEPKLLTLVEQLYDLRGPVSDEEFRALAEAWKPFRTWAAVLIRAAAPRVLGDEPAQSGTNPAGRRRRIGHTVATGTVAPHRAETVRS